MKSMSTVATSFADLFRTGTSSQYLARLSTNTRICLLLLSVVTRLNTGDLFKRKIRDVIAQGRGGLVAEAFEI